MEYKKSEFLLSFQTEEEKNVYYSTYTGALVTLDNDLDYYLTKGSQDDIQKLVDLGILVPLKQNEINKFIIDRKMVEFGTIKQTSRFVIAPTLACQAKCTYCFQSEINRVNTNMTAETADNIIHYLIEEIQKMKSKKVIITFFGGEPLIAKERIIQIGSEIFKWCIANKIEYNSEIITNGILLNYAAMQEFKEKINLNFCQITLDGTREEYYRVKKIDKFDEVVNNIKEICEDIKIIIRLNITRSNTQNIKELLKYILIEQGLDGKLKVAIARVQDYYGCDDIESDCLNPVEFSKFLAELYTDDNHYKSLLKRDLLPEIRRCYCGMENCVTSTIGPKGELYKCEHYFGVPKEIIGTVLDGRYYNEAELSFYSDIDSKCIKNRCPILPTCVGGCQSERIQYGVPQDCEERKEMFLNNLKTYISL